MSIFETLTSRTPIDKGWSLDRKFRAEAADGSVYFLRISPMDRYEQRKMQFDHMHRVRALGVPMSDPIEFGTCGEGCYTLLSWIDGRDAELVLPELPEEAQYEYGMKAGRMLKTIHTLPAPFETEPWHVRWNRKADSKIAAYHSCPVKYDRGERFLEVLETDRHFVQDRPTVWHHGDFHCGNLMFDENMELRVIDFDREDAGDPWYEFNRIIWDVRAGPAFARGLLDGYFDGQVPAEFWPTLRLYQCQSMIGSLPWALDFGEPETKTAIENAQRVLEWYDNMREVVPNWYRK